MITPPSHTTSPAISGNSMLFDLEGMETTSPNTLEASLDRWARALAPDAESLPENLATAVSRIRDCAQTESSRLDLAGLALPSLPGALGRLKHVAVLDLSHNALTEFPPQLERMSQLAQLDLSGNRLSALPDTLPLPAGVERVNLNANPLTTLPEGLRQHLRRGLRLTCHGCAFAPAEKARIQTELGQHFPEDLFTPGVELLRAEAISRSTSRSFSSNSLRRRGSAPDALDSRFASMQSFPSWQADPAE